MTLVVLDNYRPHQQGQVECLNCGFTWQACAPVGVNALQCPDCARFCGVWVTPLPDNVVKNLHYTRADVKMEKPLRAIRVLRRIYNTIKRFTTFIIFIGISTIIYEKPKPLVIDYNPLNYKLA